MKIELCMRQVGGVVRVEQRPVLLPMEWLVLQSDLSPDEAEEAANLLLKFASNARAHLARKVLDDV